MKDRRMKDKATLDLALAQLQHDLGDLRLLINVYLDKKHQKKSHSTGFSGEVLSLPRLS
jgi:hypothetical protein